MHNHNKHGVQLREGFPVKWRYAGTGQISQWRWGVIISVGTKNCKVEHQRFEDMAGNRIWIKPKNRKIVTASHDALFKTI